MHELNATQGLLELALEQARAAGAARVTDLYLVVGELSTMAPAAVRHYLDVLSPGTPAEGATLHVREVSAELACRACGRRRAAAAPDPGCPGCGSRGSLVAAGHEFYLEAIDVATDSVASARG